MSQCGYLAHYPTHLVQVGFQKVFLFLGPVRGGLEESSLVARVLFFFFF
jgi:hypothetical protein